MSASKEERAQEKAERAQERLERREERAAHKAERAQEREQLKAERIQEREQLKAERIQERERRKQEEAPLSPEQRFENFRSANDPESEQEKLNELERRKRIHSFLRTEYARISLYVILTFTVIYLIKNISDHSPFILSRIVLALNAVGAFLKPLILGFVIAYLLYPLMKFFAAKLDAISFIRNKPGRSRSMAVILTLLLIFGGIILLLSIVISAITHQVRMISLEDFENFTTSLITSVNDMYTQLMARISQTDASSEELQSITDMLSSWYSSFSTNAGSLLTGSVSNITNFFQTLLFAVIFAIYFMLDSDGLTSYWDKVLRSLSSRRFYRGFHLFLQDADTVFSGYIRGQMIDAVIMFMLVSIALSVLNIQFAVIIGIMTGIGNLIPYVGPFIAYGSTIIVCLIAGDWQKLLISVIVLFIIQTIDGNVINPRLLSNNIHVHPMLVIVALLAGSGIGGLVGMLIAVPTAALIKIWFDRIVDMLLEHREAKHLHQEEHAEKHSD